MSTDWRVESGSKYGCLEKNRSRSGSQKNLRKKEDHIEREG